MEPQERIPLSDKDPSLPEFHFSDAERKKFKEEGLTDEEIDKKEAEARVRQTQKKIEDEREG